MKLWLTARLFGAALLVSVAAACGGGGDDGASGTLRLALTDAPACGYKEVNVTVQKVRVHQSATAGDNEGGWSEVELTPPRRVNLLALTNGVLAELGQTGLPAGQYTLLRLVLVDNTPGNPLANSVVLSGSGTEVALKTPSAQQSGLKIKVNIPVAANQLADFVLDFDACKSVVVAGHSGQRLLKPVLRMIPRTETGVVGEVSAALVAAGASVSLQKDGAAARSTAPANDGSFRLQPVEPGSYTLVVTARGYTTAVVKNVQVFLGQVVRISPVGQKIDPPSSATATVGGKVVTGEAEINAVVRLRQGLAGGPTIELLAMPVNSGSGAYEYPDIAVGAPRVAPFASGASLSFTADNTATSALSVQALYGSTTENSDPFALSANEIKTIDFPLP